MDPGPDHEPTYGPMNHHLTKAEVCYLASQQLNRRIARSTFKRWKAILEIAPEYAGQGVYLYSDSDVECMVALGRWLASGRTVKQFKQEFKLGEYANV